MPVAAQQCLLSVSQLERLSIGIAFLQVVHEKMVTWLARWLDSFGHLKYVWLATNSPWKVEADLEKYETARRLKFHIKAIRCRLMRPQPARLLTCRAPMQGQPEAAPRRQIGALSGMPLTHAARRYPFASRAQFSRCYSGVRCSECCSFR